MSFERDFDTLLNNILTDYRNQFPEADTSQGSMIFIRSACLASALWGLYKYQDYIADQIFPDTGDTTSLEHHAWVRGLSRKVGETDAELLVRLLEYIRRPPAGGNKYDYVKWAKEITGVAAAWCVSLAQGPGTVDVIILANAATTGSEIPTETLLNTVRTYIADLCPTHVKTLRVLAPEVLTQNVTITCTGSVNTATIQAAISTYLNALQPGQTLYISQIVSIALANGASDAAVSLPAANVVPTSSQVIRPGVINVA